MSRILRKIQVNILYFPYEILLRLRAPRCAYHSS